MAVCVVDFVRQPHNFLRPSGHGVWGVERFAGEAPKAFPAKQYASHFLTFVQAFQYNPLSLTVLLALAGAYNPGCSSALPVRPECDPWRRASSAGGKTGGLYNGVEAPSVHPEVYMHQWRRRSLLCHAWD